MVGDGEQSVCNKSMLGLIVSHRNLQFNNLRLKLHSKVFREEDDERTFCLDHVSDMKVIKLKSGSFWQEIDP